MSLNTLISRLTKWKRKEANKKLNKSKNRWKTSIQEGKYKKWRISVCELNKRYRGSSKYYICEKCNKQYKTTRYIHAHHIFSWEKYPNKRYTVKNGIVLCINCHKKFHNTYKYDALDQPKLLIEYIGYNQRVKKYINSSSLDK